MRALRDWRSLECRSFPPVRLHQQGSSWPCETHLREGKWGRNVSRKSRVPRMLTCVRGPRAQFKLRPTDPEGGISRLDAFEENSAWLKVGVQDVV